MGFWTQKEKTRKEMAIIFRRKEVLCVALTEEVGGGGGDGCGQR